MDYKHDISRRRVLRLTGATVTGLAGCAGDNDTRSEGETPTDPTQNPATTDTPTEATDSTQTTTQENTTDTQEQTEVDDTTETTQTTTRSQEEVLLEDVKNRRDNLTDDELAAEYRSNIPDVTNYSLDFDRVQEENETRRDQLIDITTNVGAQYEDWVEGNHAVTHAIHQLPWMNWENENILNIVTRYNSRPGEQITINYQTENGSGRNLDGTWARHDNSGPNDFIENIPDSRVMDGSETNSLVTDLEAWRKSFEEANWEGENYKALRLVMQSVIPGVRGPSYIDDREPEDIGMVLDDDAIQFIGESYAESPELVNEVSTQGLEIALASEDVRNSGRYIEVTASDEGLEIADNIYSQEEAEEKLREPIDI